MFRFRSFQTPQGTHDFHLTTGPKLPVLSSPLACKNMFLFSSSAPTTPPSAHFYFPRLNPAKAQKWYFTRCPVVPTTQCSENFLECPEKYFISVVFICPYHNRPHLFFSPAPKLKRIFYSLPQYLFKSILIFCPYFC